MPTLKDRGLPPLLAMNDGAPVASAAQWPARCREILSILEENLFGRLPGRSASIAYEITREDSTYYHGGKSILLMLRATVACEGREASWDIACAIPKAAKPVPAFMLIGYGATMPGDIPTEEICERGYAVIALDYKQIAGDDADFTTVLAGLVYPDGTRGEHDAGKIALWAWAMKRTLDAVPQLVPEIDAGRVIAAGHSRLGKTALWAAASDERFFGAYSNDSGCTGAALARGGLGELPVNIASSFPYWFAPAYARIAADVEHMPFDQHFLLALLAPRPVHVCSASEDLWGDPSGEFACCAAVTPVYNLLGKTGVDESAPQDDDMPYTGGTVSYHRRPGTHAMTRLDWLRAMDAFDKEMR